MAYDPLAASLALLENGFPDEPLRLSRRRRVVPIAVDVDGNAAVTVFLRRSVGCNELHINLLTHRRVGWQLHGGGGGGCELDEFTGATSVPARSGRVVAGAGVAAGPRRNAPWGDAWIDAAVIELGVDVAAVRVGRRVIAVPWHHHVAVVWRAEGRRPDAELLDAAGTVLARLPLASAGDRRAFG